MKNEQKFTYHTGGKTICTPQKAIPVKDWLEEGKRLFGPDPLDWRFQCPTTGATSSLTGVSSTPSVLK